MRLEYGAPSKVEFTRWKATVAVVSSVVAVACLAVWLTQLPTQVKETVPSKEASVPLSAGETTRLSDWPNDDSITVGEEAIRRRAISLEQSYCGSDPLPVVAPFEGDLRRLKKSLDTFEKQVP